LQKVGGEGVKNRFLEKCGCGGQIKALFGKNVVMGVTQPAVEPGTPPTPGRSQNPFLPQDMVYFAIHTLYFVVLILFF